MAWSCTHTSGTGQRLITSRPRRMVIWFAACARLRSRLRTAFFTDLRRRAVAEFGFAIDPRHFAVIGLSAKCQADAGALGDFSAG